MTEDAAELFAWARRADTSAEEAWAELRAMNDGTEWDPERMLAAMESAPEDSDGDGTAPSGVHQ